jgi:hypothetical protein
MNPVPFLTVTWKGKDEAMYWTTHTIILAKSDVPVGIPDQNIRLND